MALIQIASPDPLVRRRVMRALDAGGYATIEIEGALEVLRVAFESRPSGAVVDLMSEGLDGVELVRLLRAATDMPILCVAPDGDVELIAEALDHGADDVVERSCPVPEILARMRATLRRYAQRRSDGEPAREVSTGSLVIDRDAKQVSKGGVAVQLTRTEYRLIDALATRVGEVVRHEDLLREVWGDEYIDDKHYLRIYVGYLRAKIEEDAAKPTYILNEWGIGYRLASLPLEHISIRAA
jgi:two-component system KDP operon response regulator KdpE